MNGAANVALKAPLTLDFEVRDGDKVLASLPAVDLQRRGGVAIVLRGTAGNYTVAGSDSTLAN
jgi:alginate O-acetyltransferase complex protein AlgF